MGRCCTLAGLLLLHLRLQQALNGERMLTEEEEQLVDDVLRDFDRIRRQPAPAGTGQRCGAANTCHLHKGHPGPHEDHKFNAWS